MTHIFHITNMHCDDCATLIDDTLRALPGVHNAHATMTTHEIRVDLDPGRTSPDTVTAAITELGFHMKPPSTIPPEQPVESVTRQVSDDAWRIVEPLLPNQPPKLPRGVREHRQLFEGIAYKHQNDVPWREVPPTFGPWQTLYAAFARWRSDGTWARVAAAAQHDASGELAWVRSAVDRRFGSGRLR